jgi:hypothetical protein
MADGGRTRTGVIGKLQEVYDRLPADVPAEIPLQRVWALGPASEPAAIRTGPR